MTNDSKPKVSKAEILNLIQQSENGLNIQQILTLLENKTAKRSIQRHLTELVTEKMIYRVDKGPATLYQALQRNRTPLFPASPQSSSFPNADWIPLSDAGKKVMEIISRPIGIRPPVSYRRELLDSYQPNKTEYLDQPTRGLLHHLGKTSDQTRPAGTYGHEILHRLLIDLSWASSKLEGNTYSRLDTKRLIEYGESVEGKEAIETEMILNHKEAITFLVENIDVIDINRQTLLNLHGLLSDGLLFNPQDSGRLRTQMVDIAETTYKPLAIYQVIDECFNLIIKKAADIKDPFEQSFFLMVHLPYLQPFIDVNKRLSRLSANIPLLKNNLCPLTFIGMPNKAYIDGTLGIYELNDVSLLRDVFVLAYERSAQEYLAVHQSLVAPDPIRSKNREHIKKLVNQIVKTCEQDPEKIIDEYAKIHVAEAEQSLFKKFVIKELELLHEGVLARYRLSEADFEKWVESKK